MADVVLDANVLVGYLDANDSQHARATELIERPEAEGHESVLLDGLVAEAISVLCRRARERKARPPDLATVLSLARRWHENGEIEPALSDVSNMFVDVLDVIDASAGRLNFNDALLVVLQRGAVIDDVASFDVAFDAVDGFRRIGEYLAVADRLAL
ncbi:MAG TPA: type II toxin-antitoxin system VapC family toxin [Kofleriaceae bacterium]|nr:type II toxin-antitoxin system VapC family toxin [Kofleriaceae bacterium]